MFASATLGVPMGPSHESGDGQDEAPETGDRRSAMSQKRTITLKKRRVVTGQATSLLPNTRRACVATATRRLKTNLRICRAPFGPSTSPSENSLDATPRRSPSLLFCNVQRERRRRIRPRKPFRQRSCMRARCEHQTISACRCPVSGPSARTELPSPCRSRPLPNSPVCAWTRSGPWRLLARFPRPPLDYPDGSIPEGYTTGRTAPGRTRPRFDWNHRRTTRRSRSSSQE